MPVFMGRFWLASGAQICRGPSPAFWRDAEKKRGPEIFARQHRKRINEASLLRDVSGRVPLQLNAQRHYWTQQSRYGVMNIETNLSASNTFEVIKRVNERGGEFWSARELARVLDYSDFRNFIGVINKARKACANSNRTVADHFVDITEMVGIGSGALRPIEDWALSRYACYLVIQNADPTKPLVALGQNYFAVQTRRQELADDKALKEDQKRLLLRQEMKRHDKHLASAAREAGVVQPMDYAIFMEHGYRGLYGGLAIKEIHGRKGLEPKEHILDRMTSSELAANLFRATQT